MNESFQQDLCAFGHSSFFNDLIDLSSSVNTCDEILLLGDLNLGKLQTVSNDLNNFLNMFSFSQHVRTATFASGNILDMIITRSSSTLISHVCTSAGISDHDAVLFSVKVQISIKSHDASETVSYRPFRAINTDQFSVDIFNAFSTLISNCESHSVSFPNSVCSSLVSGYNTAIRSILGFHAPVRTIRARQRPSLPWFSADLRVLRCNLRRAEKRWRATGLTIDRQLYISSKSLYHVSIEAARHQHLSNALNEVSDRPKALWSVINRCLGRKAKSHAPEATDKLKLAEDFNTFFLDKPKLLQSVLLRSLHGPGINGETANTSSPPSGIPVLTTFCTVTELDVSKLLSLSPRKSCLLDPIPAWLLYKCKSAFIPAITKIINAALSEGMPLEFKVSSVTPILKKRGLDTEVFSSYRPVSNLPFLSKLIERAASSQITRHLSNNNLWDPHQSAYRVSHSCETALLYVFNGILKGMDDRKVTLLVLLDLSSAFDCVDHNILANRMRLCGIGGDVHKWIMSYLDDRKQFVSCGGVSSSTCSVTCGVPQGSVLGPLLFNLYLTGLRDVILPFSVDYMVYADDLQLSATTTLSDIYWTITRLEECITAIQSWFSFSLLTLNVLKTEFIILGSPSLISKCKCPFVT
jgi:hypothetical protein